VPEITAVILPSLRVTAGARDLFARPSIETRAGRASLQRISRAIAGTAPHHGPHRPGRIRGESDRAGNLQLSVGPASREIVKDRSSPTSCVIVGVYMGGSFLRG
jgi:hypothetical protein